MLIRVFPPHYQLVYINFDISSFSLISYILKRRQMQQEMKVDIVYLCCFYLSKRRQMQLIFSKRLISNLFSLFFRLYFLTFYLLKS